MFTESEKAHIIETKNDIRHRIEQYKNIYPGLPWVSIFLSGGAICSILRNEQVNDFDFYFKTELSRKVAIETLTLLYKLYIKEYDPKYAALTNQSGKLITDNAITMVDGAQFITCMHGQPEEIKKSFDYLHCCPHYYIDTAQLFISKSQYDAIMNKKLVYCDPVRLAKPFRQEKFMSRGWSY